jgi:lambda repressor-like predicted transcriptional regulator
MDGVSYVQLNSAAISAVSLTSHQSGPKRSSPAMSGAATALGMSSSDLLTALRGGQSLSAVASSKGVSQDTLIAAMTASIQQANPSISADQATKVATAIATRTPSAGGSLPPDPNGQAQGVGGTSATGATHGHHGHHRHHAVSAAMDSAAQTLGTTTSDLASSLQSGQSLSSIASAKGVSQTALITAMATALQGADSSLSSDQATRLATSMVNGPSQNNGQAQPWVTGSAGQSSTISVAA